MSRGGLLCLFVVVTGLLLPSAQGLTSEEEFDRWVALHAAKQATVAATATVPDDVVTVAATPTCVRYVGKKGSGAEYTKVKNAVKSIPEGSTERCVIYIGEGVYT